MVRVATWATLDFMKACGEQNANPSSQRRARPLTPRDSGDAGDEHDAFVALLTQKLRTNLQAMLGFTQLMQRDQTDPLPERQRKRADRVIAAGDQLLHVLDSAHALSRIEAGEVPVTIHAVDVLRVFQRVRVEVEPAAVSRKLELLINTSGAPLPEVAADSRAFTEILLKLAANAIAYNKPHGSVTFRASPRGSAHLRISVIDTGIGVPLGEQHKLFHPFPHLARSTPGIEGVGLGLVTCQRLAALMCGSVGCRSVPDHGSEFWVELPIYSETGRAGA